MTNTEREQLIKNRLKSGAWKLKTTKQGFEVYANDVLLGKSATRHEALKIAATSGG